MILFPAGADSGLSFPSQPPVDFSIGCGRPSSQRHQTTKWAVPLKLGHRVALGCGIDLGIWLGLVHPLYVLSEIRGYS